MSEITIFTRFNCYKLTHYITIQLLPSFTYVQSQISHNIYKHLHLKTAFELLVSFNSFLSRTGRCLPTLYVNQLYSKFRLESVLVSSLSGAVSLKLFDRILSNGQMSTDSVRSLAVQRLLNLKNKFQKQSSHDKPQ